ncbi:MAG: 30S ribosomal protein S5 [Candidatus Taylorbacteria bacterium]|nr:30S ribosomal protein S5 [Candidatus Taylorbacteria bacterium]
MRPREQGFGSQQGGRGRGPRGRRGDDRPRSEFDQKTLQVRRVTRVTSGGKRFNISIVLAIGNHRGSVGVGTGKGLDTALALDKALKSAKKNMISIPVTKTMSIPHRVEAKYGSARVMIMPAPRRGNIAGSAVRSIFWLAGLKDVNAKILSGSKNKLNIARASIDALRQLKPAKVQNANIKAQTDSAKLQNAGVI